MFNPDETTVSERDQGLGRWRWPENPDYVVYPSVRVLARVRTVVVLHEPSGDNVYIPESSGFDTDEARAALAYFAAHPVSKPWHDAKPGEAWVITYGGEEHAVISDGAFFLWQSGSEQSIKDSRISAGRRIWPEVSDA